MRSGPYLVYADPNRALLDRRVVCDLLGFNEDIYAAVRRLSAKWCAEPSVHGGKRRPRGAGLVMQGSVVSQVVCSRHPKWNAVDSEIVD